MIVDEFTGRIMPGRRYSDGLHQAIEAKEYVKAQRSKTLLRRSYFQNLTTNLRRRAVFIAVVRLYRRKEFRDIYGMDVIEPDKQTGSEKRP